LFCLIRFAAETDLNERPFSSNGVHNDLSGQNLISYLSGIFQLIFIEKINTCCWCLLFFSFLCRKRYLSGNLISVDCRCPLVHVTWENPKDIEVYVLTIYWSYKLDGELYQYPIHSKLYNKNYLTIILSNDTLDVIPVTRLFLQITFDGLWICSPGYMWGLAFYSHVESTSMTASFQ